MQEENAVFMQGKKCMGMTVNDDPIKAWAVAALMEIPQGVAISITPRLFKEQPSPGVATS